MTMRRVIITAIPALIAIAVPIAVLRARRAPTSLTTYGQDLGVTYRTATIRRPVY